MKAKFIKLFCAGAGILALGEPSVLQADVIFDNLSPLGTGNSYFVGTGSGDGGSDDNITESLGQGFTIGPNSETLTSVVLGIDGGGDGGNFMVGLYGPAGPAGDFIEALNGAADPATQNYYTYTPGAPVILAANTTYYIVAANSSPSGSYIWDTGTSIPSVGTSGGSIYTSMNNSDIVIIANSPWKMASSPESLQVNGAALPMSPVPEPHDWAPASAALLGVVWMFRNRLRAKLGSSQTSGSF